MKLQKLNNHGMSIVSALVASAISLMVMSGLSMFLSNMNRQVSMIEDKGEYLNIFEEVKADFYRKQLCDVFLKNKKINISGNFLGLKAKSQSITLSKAQINKDLPYINQSRIKFDSFDLKVVEKISFMPPLMYKGKLYLKMKKNNKPIGYIRFKALLVNLEMDAFGRVTSCSNASDITNVPTVVRVTKSFIPNLPSNGKTTIHQLHVQCPKDHTVVDCYATRQNCSMPPCIARHIGKNTIQIDSDPVFITFVLSSFKEAGIDQCRLGVGGRILPGSSGHRKKVNLFNKSLWFATAKCLPGMIP